MADPGDVDQEAMLRLAVDLARSAGALLLEGLHRSRTQVDTKSSRTDMVTEMDRPSEAAIVAGLRRARPDDAVLGEEGGARAGSSGVRWIIDPLDGTTNYLYGFPSFAVSIGAELDGQALLGAVHDPVHGETFTALVGEGARRNGQPLRVGAGVELATALVGTGFAYQAERRAGRAPESDQKLEAQPQAQHPVLERGRRPGVHEGQGLGVVAHQVAGPGRAGRHRAGDDPGRLGRVPHERRPQAHGQERPPVGLLVARPGPCGHVTLRVLPDAGAEPSRLDQRDPDAVAGHLHTQGVGGRLQGVLGRGVPAREGGRGPARDGRDVDDATASLGPHGGQGQAGQAHGGDDHGLEQGASLLVGDVLDGARLAVAGVVHHAIGGQLCHRLPATGWVGDVEEHGLDLDAGLGRGLGHHVGLGGRAHRADGAEAPPGQPDHRRQPEAGTGSGGEHGPRRRPCRAGHEKNTSETSWTSLRSTVLSSATASASGTRMISAALRATMWPKAPSCTASMAPMPKRVASTRSKAVGVPPRWTWPRIVTRDSNPVRFSISSATTLPMPPRRTWPNWSTSPDCRLIVPSLGAAPSATTTMDAKRPFSWRRFRLSHTTSMSNGSSGMRISAAPPAIPA